MGRTDWYGHFWGPSRKSGNNLPPNVVHKDCFVEHEQQYLGKMAQRSPNNRPLLSAAEEGKKTPENI